MKKFKKPRHIVIVIIIIFIKISAASAQCPSCEDFSFYYPTKICVGEKIQFEPGTYNCNQNPHLRWDYGESTGLTSESSHTYNFQGSYDVSLVLPASNGCDESRITQRISVVPCEEFDCNDHHDVNPHSECDLVVGISAVIIDNACPAVSFVLTAIVGGTYHNPNITWTTFGTTNLQTNIQNSFTPISVNSCNSPDCVAYETNGDCDSYVTVTVSENGCVATSTYKSSCCGNCTNCSTY